MYRKKRSSHMLLVLTLAKEEAQYMKADSLQWKETLDIPEIEYEKERGMMSVGSIRIVILYWAACPLFRWLLHCAWE